MSAGPGPGFWPTVGLLLRFARRRSHARGQRNRELLNRKGAGDSREWESLAVFFYYIVVGVMHGAFAFALLGIADVARQLPLEGSGRLPVSARLLDRVDEIERGSRAAPGGTTNPAVREAQLRTAFDREAGRRESRDRRDRGAELFEHYRRHGRDGFVVLQEEPGLGSHGRILPLTAFLGSLIVVGWFVSLALQGEGLEFDLQRRRQPMWEWLLSHPVDPRAVFLAEMLAPFWANPMFVMAPVFWIVAFTAAYDFGIGFWAGLAAGVPLAVAAACVSKSVEIVSFLRLPVRSRGAVLGILSWLGQATNVILLFTAFSPRLLTAAARLLSGLAEAVPGPILAGSLGLWGEPSAWKGVLACNAMAVAMIAATVVTSARATRRGLAGAFAGGADAPAVLSPSGRSAFARDPLHRKELLWLWRDRGAIVQVFLVPLTLAAFQLFNFRGVLLEATRGWHLMAGGTVLLGSYFLAILGPRSLASEGAALWIPLTWPRSLEDLLRAKARLWWLVSCVVVGPLLLLTAGLFPGQAWKVALVALVWVAFARSLAERSVTLVTLTSASGEPDPIPRGRRYAATMGTLTFALGVLTQQWALATAGVVYSWLTTAALWQNFRARLPYLFDQWSERLPPPPTVLHAMVSITLALEVMTIVTAVAVAAGGPERLWLVRTLAYGLVGVLVALGLWRWLAKRGVSMRALWRFDAPVPSSRIAMAGLAAMGAGGAMALLATGYLLLVERLPQWVTGPLVAPPPVGPTQRWWLLAAVAVMAPLGEEVLFRGMLFRALAREWTAAQAVAGSACFFAIYHPPAAWLPVGMVGALCALAFRRSGHLLPSVLLHAAYNATLVALGR